MVNDSVQRNTDKRNNLNDLTAKEWLISTKSVWTYSDYDLDPKLPKNLRHLKKLILFFTKKDDLILNPKNNEYIKDIGSELGRKVRINIKNEADFILVEELKQFRDIQEYKTFLSQDLPQRYNLLYKRLKNKKYLCIISKNFYFKGSELILFHYDLTSKLSKIGLNLKGMVIWLSQERKDLKVFNDINEDLIHYNILIYRKDGENAKFREMGINNYGLLRHPEKTIYYPSFIESITPPRDKYKAQHPATFSEHDIKRLIEFFTKDCNRKNDRPRVLDPFCGVGSTLLACSESQSEGWGIELTKKWVDLTAKRFQKLGLPIKIDGKTILPAQKKLNGYRSNKIGENKKIIQNLTLGDSKKKILEFEDNSFDFIVTSPPYWGILTKKLDHKTKRERVNKGYQVKYTIKGEDGTFHKDLGNIQLYDEFLNQLKIVFKYCFEKLKMGKYMAVVVSDFRDKSEYYLYHCDIANLLREIGFKLTGLTILFQNNKRLYPYGYPFVFVPNIHNQNIIIVKKEF
ncbi:MAG: DNA methyltransferase [Candidatus Helarchaeota archaeon]